MSLSDIQTAVNFTNDIFKKNNSRLEPMLDPIKASRADVNFIHILGTPPRNGLACVILKDTHDHWVLVVRFSKKYYTDARRCDQSGVYYYDSSNRGEHYVRNNPYMSSQIKKLFGEKSFSRFNAPVVPFGHEYESGLCAIANLSSFLIRVSPEDVFYDTDKMRSSYDKMIKDGSLIQFPKRVFCRVKIHGAIKSIFKKTVVFSKNIGTDTRIQYIKTEGDDDVSISLDDSCDKCWRNQRYDRLSEGEYFYVSKTETCVFLL
jgi:hypothetical protein